MRRSHFDWPVCVVKDSVDGCPLSFDSNAVETTTAEHCISLYIYHFSTVIDFSSEKYSGSTGSQSQLRNDKYIMMQYTNWINSTPSQQ